MDPIRKALRGTGGCSVEIRVPDETKAQAAAKRLARIFESCGYPAAVIVEASTSREGVQLFSSTANAQPALAIQSAFQSAGIDALLTVHEKARGKVIVQLGHGALI